MGYLFRGRFHRGKCIVRLTAFDFETALIRPGVTAPEACCLTWQTWSDRNPVTEPAKIVHANEAEPILRGWLEDKERYLVGANTSFDMGVVCANYPGLTDLVWDAYDANRVTDVQVRQQLIDIARGQFQGYNTPHGEWIKPRYALSEVAKRYGMFLDKPKSVPHTFTRKTIDDPMHARLRFQELRPFVVAEWDSRARDLQFTGPSPTIYAKEDAEATLVCWLAQEEHRERYLRLQHEYTYRSWCMFLMSAWGVRTDPERVAALGVRAEEERAKLEAMLIGEGLVRENGTRDTKAARALMVQVCKEIGMKVPETAKGAPSLAEDACDSTEDPLLMTYAQYGRWGTVVNGSVAALAKGTVYPLHTRMGIAATGRGTSSGPNMQNFSRMSGPRECIVPRPGMVFIQADYEALELRTLAQVCIKLLGASKLADALNAGIDPHLQMAASILGISYDRALVLKNAKNTALDNARQTGKVANFGFPGGLGPKNLVIWAKKTYDISLTEGRARELKQQWLATWPEMVCFFDKVNKWGRDAGHSLFESGIAKDGLINVEVPISGWMRGGATYCAACNTLFQSLGAAAAGRGFRYLAKACYRDRSSILFGSRNVLHIHDENIGEILDDMYAHEKALEWERLMVKGANEMLPDVPATAPPMLMRWWSKKAWPVKDERGMLVPWEGQEAPT